MNIFKVFKNTKGLWWQIPSLYHSDEEEHKKATWIELYFDLVFVISMGRISSVAEQIFHHEYNFINCISIIIILISICTFWRSVTYDCDIYEVDTIRHRVIMITLMIPIALISFSMNESLIDGGIFNIGFIFSRLVLILLWTRIKFTNKFEKHSAFITKLSFSISVVLALLTFILNNKEVSIIIYGFALIQELFLPILSIKSFNEFFIISKTHYPERYGLFIMLVFGEEIISIFNEIVYVHYINILLGIIMFFIISSYWWIYYDQFNYLSFKNKPVNIFLWELLHVPVVISLVLIKIPFIEIINNYELTYIEHKYIILFIIANAVFLISVAIAGFCSDLYTEEEDEEVLESNALKIYLYSKITGCFIVAWIMYSGIQNGIKVVLILLILMFLAFQGNYYWLKNKMKKKEISSLEIELD